MASFLQTNSVPLLFLALLIGAFLWLRTHPTEIDSFSALDKVVRASKATVIEFYSNF